MAGGCENNAGWVSRDNNGGGTGREARKQGELEQCVEGDITAGSWEPCVGVRRLGIRFTNNDINSAGRDTASG